MAKVSGQDGKIVLSANVAIQDATGTTTITVESDDHGRSIGDRVLIESVVGMTDINGEHTVLAGGFTVDQFTILISTTAQTYTSGGTVKECVSITGWTLDLTSDAIDTTDSSSTTWNEFITSDFVGGSGSFEGFYESATNDLVVGNSYPIVLRQSGAIYYTGTAYITGNSSVVDIPGAEAVKKTYTFTCTASVTLTTA